MRGLIGCLMAVLAGCGGGGGGGGDGADGGEPPISPGPSASACDYIHGGGTSTLAVTGCAACTVENAERAVDGDADTYAQITWPAAAGSGAMALRAIAQEGVIFPAGNMAGALVSTHSGQVYAETAPEARTYQGNTPASADCCAETNVVGGGDWVNRKAERVYVQSETDFDTVEITYTRGGSAEDAALRIYEFCSD